MATEPPPLWSSEQNVPTAQPRCAKQSLFSKTPWTQAQSRSLGDPASLHRCRCADSCANLRSTIASPISSLVLEVIIDVAQRNLGFARDVGKRGGVEPLLVRQVHRRTNQPRALIDRCLSHGA